MSEDAPQVIETESGTQIPVRMDQDYPAYTDAEGKSLITEEDIGPNSPLVGNEYEHNPSKANDMALAGDEYRTKAANERKFADGISNASLPVYVSKSKDARESDNRARVAEEEAGRQYDAQKSEEETPQTAEVAEEVGEVALSPEVAGEDLQAAEIAEKTSHITVALEALRNMPDFEGKDTQIAELEAEKEKIETEVRQNDPERLRGLEEALPLVMKKATEFIRDLPNLQEKQDKLVLHIGNPHGSDLRAELEPGGDRVIGPGALDEISKNLLAITGSSELTEMWTQHDTELHATATGPSGITLKVVSKYGTSPHSDGELPHYVNFYLRKEAEAPSAPTLEKPRKSDGNWESRQSGYGNSQY